MTGTINLDTYSNTVVFLRSGFDLFCGSTGMMSRKDEGFT